MGTSKNKQGTVVSMMEDRKSNLVVLQSLSKGSINESIDDEVSQENQNVKNLRDMFGLSREELT